MLAYARHQINVTNHLPRDQAFEAAMKSCCDVVYLTGGANSFMLGVVVLVYNKNPSLLVNQLPSVDLCVTSVASIQGVFSMMVTTKLPKSLKLFPLAGKYSLSNYYNNFMLKITDASGSCSTQISNEIRWSVGIAGKRSMDFLKVRLTEIISLAVSCKLPDL